MDSQRLNKMFTRANYGFVLAKWTCIFYGLAFIVHGINTQNTFLMAGFLFFFYMVWVLFKLETQFYYEYYTKFKAKNIKLRVRQLDIRFQQRIRSQAYFRAQANNWVK